jgi:hypothetical protein
VTFWLVLGAFVLLFAALTVLQIDTQRMEEGRAKRVLPEHRGFEVIRKE